MHHSAVTCYAAPLHPAHQHRPSAQPGLRIQAPGHTATDCWLLTFASGSRWLTLTRSHEAMLPLIDSGAAAKRVLLLIMVRRALAGARLWAHDCLRPWWSLATVCWSCSGPRPTGRPGAGPQRCAPGLEGGEGRRRGAGKGRARPDKQLTVDLSLDLSLLISLYLES